MNLYIRKNVLRSSAFVMITLCIMFAYLAVPFYEIENDGAKVGVLVPLSQARNNSNKFQYRAATGEYFYTFYISDEIFEKHINSTVYNRYILRSFDEDFADIVNCLAEKAFKNSMDYLVLYLDDSPLNTTDFDQIQYSVRKRINQTVSDVGVVIVGDMNVNSSEPRFITGHKTHMEIFHQLFPGHLNRKLALRWIKDVYQPYHKVTLSTNRSYVFEETSVPFQLSNTYKDRDLIKDRNKVDDFIITKHSVSIISYSLFGSNARYTDGVIANSKLFQTIYPGWKLWIYHDNTVPLHILYKVCKIKDVTCINMTKSCFENRMSWRFLVASVPFVSRYIIRDVDSRLSNREKAAVDEWIVSGKKFHVMRDHPFHGERPIYGGMWGGIRDAIPQLEDILRHYVIKDKYMKDMDFLNDIVWGIAKTSVIQHDSFFCNRFVGGQPFPTKRVGLEFVGSSFINKKIKMKQTDELKRTRPPIECVLKNENHL